MTVAVRSADPAALHPGGWHSSGQDGRLMKRRPRARRLQRRLPAQLASRHRSRRRHPGSPSPPIPPPPRSAKRMISSASSRCFISAFLCLLLMTTSSSSSSNSMASRTGSSSTCFASCAQSRSAHPCSQRHSKPVPSRGVVRRSTLPRVWVLEAQQGSGEKERHRSSRWIRRGLRCFTMASTSTPQRRSSSKSSAAIMVDARDGVRLSTARRGEECGWMRAGWISERNALRGRELRPGRRTRGGLRHLNGGREVLHHRDRLVADRGHFDPSRGSAQEFQALECLTIDVLRRGEDGLGPRSAGPQPGVGVRVHEWDDVDIVAGANIFTPDDVAPPRAPLAAAALPSPQLSPRQHILAARSRGRNGRPRRRRKV